MAMAQQSGRVPSGQYDAFRENGFPTYYGEVKTAWQADILEAGLIFAFCILALAFFAILPGVQGKQVSIVLLIIIWSSKKRKKQP